MSQLNNTNEEQKQEPIISENTRKKIKSSTKIIIFLAEYSPKRCTACETNW